MQTLRSTHVMNDILGRLPWEGRESRILSAYHRPVSRHLCAPASMVTHLTRSAGGGTEAPGMPGFGGRSQSKTAAELKLEAGVTDNRLTQSIRDWRNPGPYFHHPLSRMGLMPSVPTLSLSSFFAAGASR